MAQLSRKQNRFMTNKRQQHQQQTVNEFAVRRRAKAHTQTARQYAKKNIEKEPLSWRRGSFYTLSIGCQLIVYLDCNNGRTFQLKLFQYPVKLK